MEADVRANKAQVRYHPLAFLDAASNGNRYSSRAANAALCASDISVDKFVAYHDVLYGSVKGKQVQPAENSNGRTDGALQSYAQQIGIKGAQLNTFDTCVQTEQHKALVAAMTDYASSHGINATPTVKVNGKSISPTLKAFNAAVAKALEKGPAPNPSKTPTPSPSATSTATTSKSPTAASSSTRG
jgi:protein-disulfide isomerase